MKGGIAMRHRSKRSTIWFVLECAALGAALAVLIVIVLKLVSRFLVWREETKALESIRIVMSAEDAKSEKEESSQRAAEFEALKAQNPDFRGWVLFGDDHSMYVCQGEDNTYYMNHRFDRTEDAAGMIFLDAECTPDSLNTLLYGHNMKDGSRFGTLNRYTNPEFLKEHPMICYQTEEGLQRYRPVAVFYMSVEEDSDKYFDFEWPDFASAADAHAYVEAAKALSLYDTGITVKDGEKLLTLVTCTSQVDEGRLVVLCRQLRSGELAS